MNSNQMELNDLFDYGYYIYQNPDYFKFSLDSVLLAEFVDIKKKQKKVLDLCSGNAPVLMILASKYKDVSFYGVELQKEVYELGIKSIEYNKFDNIKLYNHDVKDIISLFPKEKFDVICSNPPYFKVNSDELINDNEIKAIARHEIKLDIDSLVEAASKVINNQGYFYMVHRSERLIDIFNSLKKYNFGLKKIQPVYSDYNKDSTLILIEAIYNGRDYVKIGKPVYLNELNSYKGIFGGE